jgi:ABC-type transport system involved in cytochrome bd biosynthesis fused ATPase/permease subunit
VTIIFSAINIFNAILVSTAIIIVLIFNEPIYTSFLILILFSFFYVIFKVKSSSILKKGEIVNLSQNKIIDVFENTVGYLPEIIIYNLEKFFSNFFSNASRDSAKSSSDIRTIGLLPRVYLEMFILIIVILIIFFLSLGDKRVENNIVYLTILAFGAQKILPLINSIYNFSVNFKGAVPIVSSFLNILNYDTSLLHLKENDKKNTSSEIIFKRQLEIKNLSYRYDNILKKILNNISLKILKGEKVL